jgi:membrane fusion protein, multidrug efflux system
MNRPSTLEQQELRVPPRPADEPPSGEPPSAAPKSRWWLWLLILVFVGLGVYYFYFRSKGGDSKASGATSGAAGARARGPMTTPVVATKARKGDIGVYITGLGAVVPIYTVTVTSRVQGQLMKVLYNEGDLVHQGDTLAEVDPRPYQVMLAQAEGQLARDQAALDVARVDLKRYQDLLKTNAVPEQTVVDQQATVDQDVGAVKTDQANIDNAKLDLVYCHITAPITGRVGLRLVDPGNMVQATGTSNLVVITQIQPISVIFTVAEDQLPAVVAKMRAGQRLGVEANDRNGKKLGQGYLATIDNQIDPSTGTIRLRAIFDNNDNALFPNEFINPRLLVEEKKGVTLLPNAAIQRNSQTSYVWFVKPDSTVTVRPITVGTTEGGNSEVTSGLSPGDTVVMTGVDKLQEGSKVIAHFEGEAARGISK